MSEAVKTKNMRKLIENSNFSKNQKSIADAPIHLARSNSKPTQIQRKSNLIKNKCDSESEKLIANFLHFLEVEKKYSPNTLNSYRIDIFHFFDFLFRVKKKLIEKCDIENLSVHEFRKWLAQRMSNHVNASNARALSSLRSFLRFLNKNN
jgi:hypothetical protein